MIKLKEKGLKIMISFLKFSAIFISFIFVSCEIPEDLNDNPNDITVSDVDANLFLNGAQLANNIVQVSHLNRISGMFSGQLVGYASLYSNIYGYSLSTVETNGEWNRAYIGVVANTRHIIESAPKDMLLVGIAKILEAHAISTLAILTGDIPYSEMLTLNDSPKFDKQKDVLNSCLVLLSEAIQNLGQATSRNESFDLYFYGDKDKWISSAYTLKARINLVMKDYGTALSEAGMGISSSGDDMMYNPRSAQNGQANLFWEILNGSRGGDLGNARQGKSSYLINLLDPSHPSYRGNIKTDESARLGYYSIVESSGAANNGIVDGMEPQPMITYMENQLIKAEASARTAGFSSGLSALNSYRAWLASGGRLNANYNDASKYKYDPYLEADFVSGGMENSDGLTKDQALMREIIEERYVSGFGTYMPFNDHRRLRGAGETNLIPPFPLNDSTATKHVERLPWAEDEIISNSSVDEDPGLFEITQVNR